MLPSFSDAESQPTNMTTSGCSRLHRPSHSLYCLLLLLHCFQGRIWFFVPESVSNKGCSHKSLNTAQAPFSPSFWVSTAVAAVAAGAAASVLLGFRPACFFGCVAVLLLSSCVAAINVFVSADTPLLQFFLYGVLWSLQLLVIALYLPYDSLKRNAQNVAVGFVTLAHSAIFLAVQRGGATSGYMIALLALFGLILAVLLFREKLAISAPWLRVMRRADMKKQEAEIVEAAIELEQQLTRALSSPMRPPLSRRTSSTPDAPSHLLVVSPGQKYEVAEGRFKDESPSDAAGLPLAVVAEEQPVIEPLHIPVEAEPQHELKAENEHYKPSSKSQSKDADVAISSGSDTPRSVSGPASPSLLHHGVSLGPGQLFMARTLLPAATVGGPSGSGTESARQSPRFTISGAVQLTPLRRGLAANSSGEPVGAFGSSAQQASSAGTVSPLQLPRVSQLPSSRMLKPLAPHMFANLPPLVSSTAASRAALQVIDLDHVMDEHDRNLLDATHTFERERQQQLQRARKLKEERRKHKKKEAAAAAAAAAEDPAVHAPEQCTELSTVALSAPKQLPAP
jgi:hypothetical protein